jgi:glyoxylase-like metal-dependent hydrolase (beta-lactamase superfamily II)
MAFYEQESRALFCGEALGLPGQGAEPFPLPAVAPPSFDQELYLETMEKLRRLEPRILFFSHGGAGSDPDRTISVAMENTRMLGDMILKALKEGQPIEAISNMLAEEAANRFGIQLSKMDLSMTVAGYKLYFQKKGLP